MRLGILWLICTLASARAACAAEPAVLLTKENSVDAISQRQVWKPAEVGQPLFERDRLRTGELSRASLRLTNLSVLRLNELTELELRSPESGSAKPTLDLKGGSLFFFSREKPQQLHLRTPLATGALRGTEFHVEVGRAGRTVVTMLEGEVELRNVFGRLLLRSGEQGTVEPGRPPVKTAMIEAVNIIQWCLYYPGVLSVPELELTPGEARLLGASLEAYRAGDLLGALRTWPTGHEAASPGERTYRAALLLCVGQVRKAEAQLGTGGTPAASALRQLIASVKFQEYTRPFAPTTAAEWMAESYYRQSRSDLEAARTAARRATEAAPQSGFAWTRLAELEFSFGETTRAMQTLERGLELAPQHAQAHALQGFYLAACNRVGAARHSFDLAIALDGALGNAWLGRGLAELRQGSMEQGRRDLQTAVALEPNRSLLRSYLGKAFSQVGILDKANLELARAKEIDPRDPTPWLYAAIERKQENRYNEAVSELEHSQALNDNRSVFRSQFLLDQDRAIRGANLAAIYRKDGLVEQSVREAVRAVNDDYTSAPAHLFLANSYDALRDPGRVQLRYETAWFNELLLSHLLSPVGGGPLSQFVSEQEYSKLFERDALGFSSLTELFSRGEVRNTTSQYGTSGQVSYALDYEGLVSNGTRPNNDLARHEGYATFKLQLSPHDTLFSQIRFQDLRSGYPFQLVDPHTLERTPQVTEAGETTFVPNRPALTYRYREEQTPGLALLGWHHDWAPGQHTLLVLSRLADEQTLTAQGTGQTEFTREATEAGVPLPLIDQFGAIASAHQGGGPEVAAGFQPLVPLLRPYRGRGDIRLLKTPTYDLEYHNRFETYSADLQQIFTFGPQTVLLGGRYQHGSFETESQLRNRNALGDVAESNEVTDPRALQQEAEVDHERINFYLYDRWRVTRWLALTAGVTYDLLHYPENYLSPPISERQSSLERLSPKIGLTLNPWSGATLRTAYAEATSGTSFDESVRLEPVQVEGFLQAYRSAIPESLLGPLPGNRYQIVGASAEQKLPSRTYLGVEASHLEQKTDLRLGSLEHLEVGGNALGNVAGELEERVRYREEGLTATANQLLGRGWSLGLRYRLTHAELERRIPALDDATAPEAPRQTTEGVGSLALADQESWLQELSLQAFYNHPSGLFARGELNWYRQRNEVTASSLPANDAGLADTSARPRVRRESRESEDEDFWQLNLLTGYRFYRNQCEISGGLLNVTGQDYRLNPLTPYLELAREPTWVLRCRVAF